MEHIEIIYAEERKSIWIALSLLYLDTELQESDFIYIANTILDSKYDFEKVKQIDKFEVFPTLSANLLNVAGVWSGFDEEWLINSICDTIDKTNWLCEVSNNFFYWLLRGMHKNNWRQIEMSYNKILVKQD